MAEAETIEEWWQRDPLGFCIAKIKDPDENIRLDCAMHLGLIGPDEPDGLKALAGALDDEDHWVRVEAAWSLWKCSKGVEVVEEDLVSALSNDDPEVRYVLGTTLCENAATSLRNLDRVRAMRDSDSDPEVRAQLVRPIWNVDGNDSSAVAALRSGLHTGLAQVKIAVANSLHFMDTVRGQMELEVQLLIQDEDSSVRAAAQEI